NNQEPTSNVSAPIPPRPICGKWENMPLCLTIFEPVVGGISAHAQKVVNKFHADTSRGSGVWGPRREQNTKMLHVEHFSILQPAHEAECRSGHQAPNRAARSAKVLHLEHFFKIPNCAPLGCFTSRGSTPSAAYVTDCWL